MLCVLDLVCCYIVMMLCLMGECGDDGVCDGVELLLLLLLLFFVLVLFLSGFVVCFVLLWFDVCWMFWLVYV